MKRSNDPRRRGCADCGHAFSPSAKSRRLFSSGDVLYAALLVAAAYVLAAIFAPYVARSIRKAGF